MGLQAGMQGVSLTRSELSAARSKGQIERYQIGNVALSEFPIEYEKGAVVKAEFLYIAV